VVTTKALTRLALLAADIAVIALLLAVTLVNGLLLFVHTVTAAWTGVAADLILQVLMFAGLWAYARQRGWS
jgi:hypothetical protein